MKKLEKDSVVIIGNREVTINEILPALAKLPADVILNYFTQLGLMFPRSLRMDALKEILSLYVNKERPHVKPLTDELVYRLRWFETFTEAQFVNLLPVFEDGILLDEYKEGLWLNLLHYMLDKQVSNENFNKLFTTADNLQKTPPLEKLDGQKFNDVLNPLFFDEDNYIDGLSTELFRPVVYKCSTLDEVRAIGRKYGVNVPRRLRKKELVEIIKEELVDRKELTPELEERIDGMTVIPLQRFAKNNDIKVSIELKKEEIIEYILKNAQQTKERYFKPQTDSYEVYDRDDFLIPGVEPIVEPVIEPVEEEYVVVTFAACDLETQVELVKGKTVKRPNDPVLDGFVFEGWHLNDTLFNFDTPVEDNIKLDAKFIQVGPEMLKVIFRYNEIETEVLVEKGKMVEPIEEPSKEGFEFIGWFLNDNLYEFDEFVNEDLLLIAQWYELEEEIVLVTFVDEETAEEIEVNKGESVDPVELPEKEGFVFAGWYLGEQLFDFETKLEDDIILISSWKETVKEPEVVYVDAKPEQVDFSEIIKEIKKVSKLVEEVKNATYALSSGEVKDHLSGIDFSDKDGFEGTSKLDEEIKEPIILMPFQAKVSRKSFNTLMRRKNKKRKVEKPKSKRPPVPVVLVK